MQRYECERNTNELISSFIVGWNSIFHQNKGSCSHERINSINVIPKNHFWNMHRQTKRTIQSDFICTPSVNCPAKVSWNKSLLIFMYKHLQSHDSDRVANKSAKIPLSIIFCADQDEISSSEKKKNKNATNDSNPISCYQSIFALHTFQHVVFQFVFGQKKKKKTSIWNKKPTSASHSTWIAYRMCRTSNLERLDRLPVRVQGRSEEDKQKRTAAGPSCVCTQFVVQTMSELSWKKPLYRLDYI